MKKMNSLNNFFQANLKVKIELNIYIFNYKKFFAKN